MSPLLHSRKRSIGAAVAVTALAALALSGCTAGTDTDDVPQDSDAEILVWTDATREPGFQQYAEQHPEANLKIETYDGGALLAKILLFNKTGEGWPDVVFSGSPDTIASLASERFGFAQDLTGLVEKDVLAGFGEANNDCVVEGTAYCLKNDLAQTVLWYNKPLMEEWGYDVPTTWAEYEELGAKVAAEHPGYVVGAAGSSGVYQDYFVPSGCPLQEVVAPDEVRVDTTDERCVRVSGMLDRMIANGSVSNFGTFDPEFIKLGQAQKILLMPAASWYGDFVFNSEANYNYPDGLITAAPNPIWDGEDAAWSGTQGGGIFVVSSHSANRQGAADLITWMATDLDYQREAATFPAYGPAAEAWGARIAEDPFYAADPVPALVAQATLINPVATVVRYSVGQAFNTAIVPAIKAKTSIVEALPKLQSTVSSLATTAGYTPIQ
jgi:ABC-type glycerol-3-phosphate transport system substrate-binding protein